MEELIVPYCASQLPVAKHVLVFAPHPDDEVFGPGGVLALYAQAGIPVSVIVLTDGAFGKNDVERKRWLELRESESVAAAASLGISAPMFWRLPDRHLVYGEVLIGRLKEAVKMICADLVFATALTEMHPDHRVLAMAAVEAVRRLGGASRLAMYEIGVPMPSPSILVDITSVIDKKEAAMACFASQLALQRYAEQIGALNRFRTYTLPRSVFAAEAFLIWDPLNEEVQWQTLFESEFQRRDRLGLLIESGDKLPLVNVIICSLDRPSLMEALGSVAFLTHGNVEVTVVNAKGGDHALIGDYCGPFRQHLLNQGGEALGYAEAANLALDHCRGEFALFLDENHQLDPQHVSLLLAELIQHPNCPAVYSGIRLYKKGGAVCERNTPWEMTRLWGMNYIPITSVLFRTHLPDGKSCEFDTTLGSLEGWDFLLQLHQFGDFRNISGCSISGRHEIEMSGILTAQDSVDFRRAHAAVIAKWSTIMDCSVVSEAILKLNTVLDQSAVDNKNLLMALEQKTLECDSASRKLSELLNSRSWKVTAPIRAIFSWWRCFFPVN